MPGPAAPPIDTPPDLILVEAEGLMAARFDLEAIELLARIDAETPESTRAALLTAVARWNLGQFDEAWNAIEGVLELEPTDPDAIRLSTWMQMAPLRGDDARVAARRWTGLATGEGAADPWAAMALGRIPAARGLGMQDAYDAVPDSVGEIREAAVTVGGYSPSGAALLRGHAGLLEGRWEQAAADYAEVVRDAPDHAQAHVDRAFALGQANHHDEAVREAFDAYRTAPNATWPIAVLRKTIDHSRGLPRRLAVALTLFATLLAGQPPGTPEFIVGAATTIAAIVAIGWMVVQIRRTPKEVRDVYRRTAGRTGPLAVQVFQGVLMALVAVVVIFGGIELALEAPENPIRSIVVLGGFVLIGYESVKIDRKWRKQVPVSWVDLSYPWHRPTSPAVVPAEG